MLTSTTAAAAAAAAMQSDRLMEWVRQASGLVRDALLLPLLLLLNDSSSLLHQL
jgi:hypothetical protein